MVVNLGADADTTAAIYGMLAGAYYGYEEIPKEWRSKLTKRSSIEKITLDLLELANVKVGPDGDFPGGLCSLRIPKTKNTRERDEMWYDTAISQALKIKYPIIQAPMARISSGPTLVATVSNAGGLGSLGAAMLSPEEITKNIREIKRRTSNPFAVNLFAPRDHLAGYQVNKQAQESMKQVANEYRRELGLNIKTYDDEVQQKPSFTFEDQVQAILDENVSVFSFTFGIPPANVLDKVKKHGLRIVGTANSVEEAKLLEQSGVDAIVAQGIEAGGHRASFTNTEMLPLFPLVQQIISQCKVPVIAAGGIMDGKGIVSMLSLGASAVQIGTLFIPTEESEASSVWKKALLEGKIAREGTILTKIVTGRQCRFLNNEIVAKLHQFEDGSFPYPLQGKIVTGEISAAANQHNRHDLMPIMSGQNAILCHKIQPLRAAQVFNNLVSETSQTMEALCAK